MLDLVSKSLNAKKIKYKVLDTLLKPTQFDQIRSNGNMVNIYIDMESLIKQLYNGEASDGIASELNTMANEDRLFISAEIIRYAAHYRHYFASRLGLPTRIFFFYSFDKFEQALSTFPDYRKHYYDTRIDDNNPTFGLVTQNLKMNITAATTVMQYIPDLYIYNTGKIEPTLLPSYLLAVDPDPDDMSIILTNQEIFYQDLLLKNNTYILEMKSDSSEFFDVKKLMAKWISGTKKTLADYTGIGPEVLPLAQVLIKNKELQFPSVKRMGKTTSLNKLKKLVNSGNLLNTEYIDPEEAYKGLSSIVDHDTFVNRFKFINHRYMMSRYESTLQNIIGPAQTINLTDPEGIKMINDNYYSRNPLDLNYLFEGFDQTKFNY